jgi:hypothetical protein
MSDISAIAAAVLISQSEVERQMSVSMIRMNAQADQAVADMVTQNGRQIQALSNATSGNIDLFV